jgi:cellulose synthase/poly-beta-1,6-N-acetylglucosamine synthase-like glycosyltransferase
MVQKFQKTSAYLRIKKIQGTPPQQRVRLKTSNSIVKKSENASENNKSPKVSVLMPAYNAAPYIGEAIQSILDQSFTDFEFIIIDDCSTDNTWELIQHYASLDSRIVAVRNEQNLNIA